MRLEAKGITQHEYDLLLKLQHGACAICKGVRPYRLDVDHDHKIERELLALGVEPALAYRWSIRGLCCRLCNRRLLTAAKDDVRILRSAIEYLSGNPVFGHERAA